MSEQKSMTTWVPTIVMGVVAILFSVYALQEQTELRRANNEIEQLKGDLGACQQQLTAEKAGATAKMDEALRQARIALAEAETQYRRALKAEGSKRK
jgi:hypothetical protein